MFIGLYLKLFVLSAFHKIEVLRINIFTSFGRKQGYAQLSE